MKITFDLLKKISDGDDEYLVNVLNSFKGSNIYEKTIEILNSWERDVSYDVTLNMDGNNVKVMISHIINKIDNIDRDDLIVGDDILKLGINFPSNFSIPDDNMFPYEIIRKIQSFESEASPKDYKKIIEKLPAKYFNSIMSVVLDNNKIVKFSNQSLSKLRINMISHDPFIFLKSLFTPFGDDYFRDIIYHLSKKIDGNLLLQSTIFDIEYYIDKLNRENNESDVPNLG